MRWHGAVVIARVAALSVSLPLSSLSLFLSVSLCGALQSGDSRVVSITAQLRADMEKSKRVKSGQNAGQGVGHGAGGAIPEEDSDDSGEGGQLTDGDDAGDDTDSDEEADYVFNDFGGLGLGGSSECSHVAG